MALDIPFYDDASSHAPVSDFLFSLSETERKPEDTTPRNRDCKKTHEEIVMRDPASLPRFTDILESSLSDPENRREYEQGLMALRFWVQIALRCEEMGLTPAQIEVLSGVSPEALLRVQ